MSCIKRTALSVTEAPDFEFVVTKFLLNSTTPAQKMPAKKSLNMDIVNQHPASKIPVKTPARKSASIASSQAGKTKVVAHEDVVPQTELEKLDSLHCKMEQSVDAFISARKELEEILSAEGSSKQEHLTRSSAGLRRELKRHRELTSRVESSLKGNKVPENRSRGGMRPVTSYDFLKSIMS